MMTRSCLSSLLLLLAALAVSQDLESEYLTIKGSNIWVRSEPTTGDVVMTVNEGDKCMVIDKNRFEFIRGVGHFWYQIEFQGKTGWVFGSQTDRISHIDIIEADDKTELWERFKSKQLEKCENEINTSGRPEDDDCLVNEGYQFLIPEIDENQFALRHQREGFTIYVNEVNESVEAPFFLIDELVGQEGAAGLSHSENFFIGFKNGIYGYQLPHEAFEGKPTKLIRKNEKQFFLVTFKEFRNVYMFYSGYYMIYLIDTDTRTIQVMSSKVGEMSGGQWVERENEGFSYVSKSEITFSGTSKFKLVEFKKTKTSDGWIEKANPLEFHHNWSKKNRRFEPAER